MILFSSNTQFLMKIVFCFTTTMLLLYGCLADSRKPFIQTISNRQRLGPAGLALHYANIVLQIDTLVSVSFLLQLFHIMFKRLKNVC